ncbi:hypothetical protein ACH5RR_012452 [Cinchona calisaya]|uniref:Replication factor A C-terminal domain-containing protein n=1 Tax=Cinchona calisaya TaxID=153742 RepID=A0ABD3A7S2_9GENT
MDIKIKAQGAPKGTSVFVGFKLFQLLPFLLLKLAHGNEDLTSLRTQKSVSTHEIENNKFFTDSLIKCTKYDNNVSTNEPCHSGETTDNVQRSSEMSHCGNSDILPPVAKESPLPPPDPLHALYSDFVSYTMTKSGVQYMNYAIHKEPFMLQRFTNKNRKMYRKEAILRWKKKCLASGILDKQKAAQCQTLKKHINIFHNQVDRKNGEGDQESAVCVRAKTKFVPKQQRLWYTACKNYHKAINADIDWDITCPSCKENSKVEVRSRLGIMLEDGTSKLHAVIFSPDAEMLIIFTALELKEADENMQIANTNTVVQLFTPTTKKILEEIAESSDDPAMSPAASTGVKRNLTFADTNPVSTIKECEAAPKN